MEETAHRKDASVVKRTHSRLRNMAADKSLDEFIPIWQQFTGDRTVLEEYASAMERLSNVHWSEKGPGQNRILVCHNCIQGYLQLDVIGKVVEKDRRRCQFHLKNNNHCSGHRLPDCLAGVGRKPRLLDVGSCNNPFLIFESFYEIVAVDLYPKHESVLPIDFVTCPIATEWPASALELSCPLVAQSFDFVVFSLFLEYLPLAQLRLSACERAHRLLRENGLLLIATPDSCSQNKHFEQFRQWKVNIEWIGFQKYSYKKLEHFHLLVFRKLTACLTGCNLRSNGPLSSISVTDGLSIPQDGKK